MFLRYFTRRPGRLFGSLSALGLYAANGTYDGYPLPELLQNVVFREQKSVATPSDAVVAGYCVSKYSANNPSEDEYDILMDGSKGGIAGHGSLFGIFDGHTGGHASKFAREYLFKLLFYLAQSDLHPSPLLTRHTLPAYFDSAFAAADDLILSLPLIEKDDPAKGQAGACTLVVHVSPERVLHVANAGDCRAVIGRRRSSSKPQTGVEWLSPDSLHYSGNLAAHEAVELTLDAEIGSNYAERERLLAEHPNEPNVIRRRRIKGRLQPTRGLGDGTYKRKEYYEQRSYEFQQKYPSHKWRPPYSTARPDISRYQLDEHDDFMILSTDGAFQDLSSEDCVAHVSKYLEQYPDGGVSLKSSSLGIFSRIKQSLGFSTGSVQPNAASALVHKTLLTATEAHHGRDSRGPAKTLGKVLSLKPGRPRRSVHDDTTIIIVMFNKQAPQKTGASLTDNQPKITLPTRFTDHMKLKVNQ